MDIIWKIKWSYKLIEKIENIINGSENMECNCIANFYCPCVFVGLDAAPNRVYEKTHQKLEKFCEIISIVVFIIKLKTFKKVHIEKKKKLKLKIKHLIFPIK